MSEPKRMVVYDCFAVEDLESNLEFHAITDSEESFYLSTALDLGFIIARRARLLLATTETGLTFSETDRVLFPSGRPLHVRPLTSDERKSFFMGAAQFQKEYLALGNVK